VLFAGAAAIEETTTPTWQSHWLDAYHRAVAAAREALGPRFAELHAFGLALAETEVVNIALLAATAVPLPGRAADRSANTAERRGSILTLREAQVSELITEGLTSQEIAVRLGIAKRTADAHTEHIMTKLGVHSRAQVAAWVERNRSASLSGKAGGGQPGQYLDRRHYRPAPFGQIEQLPPLPVSARGGLEPAVEVGRLFDGPDHQVLADAGYQRAPPVPPRHGRD
jgi:DNA-binding CsgD family transcriptional regulator